MQISFIRSVKDGLDAARFVNPNEKDCADVEFCMMVIVRAMK